MGWGITEIALVLIAFAAVSGRVRGTAITPAILFTGIGFVLGSEVLDTIGSGLSVGDIRLLAEVTLALVLFSDASALNARKLSHEAGFPARLLGIGLPLTIIFGAGAALWLFPELLLFEAIVLAVLLAPTDAALGQTVVSDKRLPSRVRQGLNVESGLNDGVCVPLLFAAVAFAELEEAPTFEGEIIVDLLKEVGIAIAVGIAVAAVVGFVVTTSKRRGWLDEAWAQVVPLAAAAFAYTTTAELGGSGFIAAFVAGLLYGRMLGATTAHSTTRLMEEVGGVLSAVTFFVFGAILIGTGVPDLDLTTIVYAVLSLTAVRMIPVALSLIGSGTARPTMAFTGWFGPRGLATIVFMLTIIEESNLPGTERIVQVATVTVLLSVVAHGASAPWLTNRYVQWFSKQGKSSEPDSDEPHSNEPATTVTQAHRSLWAHRPQQQD
jgi:NhaP-type Na+/H+ or K+/H+ antiporter